MVLRHVVVVFLSLLEYCCCQHSCHPEVTDFSRIYSFVRWKAPRCSNNLQVEDYQIWFIDVSEVQYETYVTNLTSTTSSCAVINNTICYFRVRAELEDGSSSSYSTCLNISEKLIEQQTSVWSFQDACFQVRGLCSDGVVRSRYRIDGKIPNLNDYTFTYINSFRSLFCLKNVSRMVVVTEWCDYIVHSPFCISGIGVSILSRTEVYLQQSYNSTEGDLSVLNHRSLTSQDSMITPRTIITYNIMMSSSFVQQPTDIHMEIELSHASITIWAAVSLGILLVLFLIITSIIFCAFTYKKKKTKAEQATLDPIYETIQSSNELEIKANEAYVTLSVINMESCPAYITHREIHASQT